MRTKGAVKTEQSRRRTPTNRGPYLKTLKPKQLKPFNSQDLIVNSPLYLLIISLYINYENLMVDQDNNFYLISLNILITYLLNDEKIL